VPELVLPSRPELLGSRLLWPELFFDFFDEF
jgi:hypothetical protein